MANKTVVGIVETQIQAESIVGSLQNAGFSSNSISALFPDRRGSADFAHEHNTKAPEGAVAGVAGGGILGGTLGLLAGIGALAIPGLGPFIAAGATHIILNLRAPYPEGIVHRLADEVAAPLAAES